MRILALQGMPKSGTQLKVPELSMQAPPDHRYEDPMSQSEGLVMLNSF